MPEITDLMRVAQYVKSHRDAPSDVYNAACRMLDIDMTLTAKVNGALYRSAEADVTELIQRVAQAEATIERVRRMAQVWVDIRPTYPTASDAGHGIAFAGQQILDTLNAPEKGAESNRGGRTPQTQGAVEGQEAREAQEAAQCPTQCDQDCESGRTHCAETHAVRWQRRHQPEDCPVADATTTP